LILAIGYEWEPYTRRKKEILMNMTREVPHAYVVGATGSGKSSVTKFLIGQIVENYTPDEVEIWYLDNQGLEVGDIEDFMHVTVATDNVDDSFESLSDLKDVMREREEYFKKFKEHRIKNITRYNELVENQPELNIRKMPFIVCFIDEMLPVFGSEHKDEYNRRLKEIAQVARKVGIHLVISTQRASEEHLNRELRTAIAGKIGLRVSDPQESRNVIGESGCESIKTNQQGEGYVAGFIKKTRFYTPEVTDEILDRLLEKYGK